MQDIPNRTIDLTGQIFTRWTVRHFANRTNKTTYWSCVCVCGELRDVSSSSLRSGKSKSCGCLNKEVAAVTCRARNKPRHGQCFTKVYGVWKGIKQRCNNPNNKDFSNYGGRGITICSEWESFDRFYADMGAPNSNLSIERIDNSKGYNKQNCKWASAYTQGSNKRTNHVVQLGGVSLTISQWARFTGISKVTIRDRMVHGWDSERALGFNR